jgi:uncharacterized protein YjbI with pentapeptide repeats
MTEKLNPFDVAALERSLNDSATRVSTIWVSYLIFGLYLVIATGTATDRQLFLEEPLKLPAFNIDVPLYWFFILAPSLFVLLHFYVLLQVLLLGRTAAAYDLAIERAVRSPPGNALVRQRLANTLFAQIFAGSPREREGWLGRLLLVMARITLALAPIYVVFAFQYVFLPYHSHFATWAHRVLLLVELAFAFLLWPLVLDARKDFDWPKLWRRVKRTAAIPLQLFIAKDRRRHELHRLRLQAIPVVACILFVASLSLSFPGEAHVNLFTGHFSFSAVQCDRWIILQRVDRLVLPRVDVVDDEKLDKIEKATATKTQQAFEGERTRSFRERDLNCATFDSADLRRTDFFGARMSNASFKGAQLQGADLSAARLEGANLSEAKLQGANLSQAQLQGANLSAARLEGANLSEAKLQRANLRQAQLQGADLSAAQLQDADLSAPLRGGFLRQADLHGANLSEAQLQRANLNFADLQGANLSEADLQGANLSEAKLQGADLSAARLWGANLSEAKLQGANLRQAQPLGADLSVAQLQGANLRRAQLLGADLSRAQLGGANLSRAQLGGANLLGSELKLALLSNVHLWRVRPANCSDARITDPEFDAASGALLGIDNIERVLAQVSEDQKDKGRARLRQGFTIQKDDLVAIETIWRDCAANSQTVMESEYLQQHARLLRDLVCNATSDRKEIAAGITNNWISDDPDRSDYSSRLARGLLGLDGKECAATKELSDLTNKRLREFAPTQIPAN